MSQAYIRARMFDHGHVRAHPVTPWDNAEVRGANGLAMVRLWMNDAEEAEMESTFSPSHLLGNFSQHDLHVQAEEMAKAIEESVFSSVWWLLVAFDPAHIDRRREPRPRLLLTCSIVSLRRVPPP